MKLSAWLSDNDRTFAWLGREIGVSTEAARRYANGDRMPRADEMRRIVEATSGVVTANDFYNIAAAPTPAQPSEAA